MKQVTYNPGVFDVQDIEQARRIILTKEAEVGTDERWTTETPYVADLIHQALALTPNSVVIDYGCGIGRLARELIARHSCRVVGVDISASMRALSAIYVQSDRFVACTPDMLDALVARGFRADAAYSIWVLQHCLRPAEDVGLIDRSLRPGAGLFVMNCVHRAVPTKEAHWVNDGIDIRAMLGETFPVVTEGKPSSEKVAHHPSGDFWAHLRKPG